MVFYLKYRPQTIEELDNIKVRETLSYVLKNKPPHAFLFTGPKGLGKTSAARIVAKVINCSTALDKREKGFEPCNKCFECKSITDGTNLDVLEIDGASNRGIDEIRSLREKVNLASANPQTKRKVYIIDEVHMLTSEAFNALLKTIEEPPPHVMFIFCTTEPHKVPETILSRCFHVSFSLATQEEIGHSLQRITKGEKIDADPQAIETIAHLANGGFRDASKILEEMIAVSEGKKITVELVEQKYQVSSISYLVFSLLEALSEKNTKEALEIIRKVTENGIDIKYFLQVFLEELHNIILSKVEVINDTKYKILNTKYSYNDIQTLVALFSEAYQQIKYSPIPQLPLEIAVISYNSQDSSSVILGSDATPESKEKRSWTGQDDKSGKNTVDIMRKKNEVLKIKNILSGNDDTKKEDKPKIDEVSSPKQGNMHKPSDDSTNLLENLIYKVKPFNHSVAGVLRGSKIDSMSGDSITFVTPYKFHKERLEERRSCEIIEKALREITGKNLRVNVILKTN